SAFLQRLVVVADGVRQVARLGDLDLFLALAGGLAGLLRQGVPAVRAADAGRIALALAILDRDRVATGVALVVVALGEVVAHSHPVVEDEAVAAPFGLFLRYLF